MVMDKNDTEDGAKTKTRGFNPSNYGDRDADPKARFAKIMLEEIPAAWEADKPEFKFPYQQYMGLGGSVQTRFTESVIGTWKLSLCTVNLNGVGSKRFVPAGEEYASLRRSRAKKLIRLDVRSFGRDHAPGRIERARSAGLDERSIKKRVRYDRGRQECPGRLQRELRGP
jgi:hypothetical protein